VVEFWEAPDEFGDPGAGGADYDPCWPHGHFCLRCNGWWKHQAPECGESTDAPCPDHCTVPEGQD
jgi:hypothetical protein